MKKKNLYKVTIIFIFISIIFYFFINSLIGDAKKFGYVKKLLNDEQRELVKKYIFPYKLINQQKRQLDFFKPLSVEIELLIKEQGIDLDLIRVPDVKLSNNKTLKKYKLNSGFHFGIANVNPGSAYIDFYNNNIFIVSSRGVLAYGTNIEDKNTKLKQIKNNIDEFIGLKQFKKSQSNSIKDLLIDNENIYLSFTDEIKENCWNTSVIFGKINFEEIKFKKLFSNSDVFVHPTLQDAYGVYIEALAYELPTISSSIYDKDEVIIDNICGLLIKPPFSLFESKIGREYENYDEFVSIIKSKYENGEFDFMIKEFYQKLEYLHLNRKILKQMRLNCQNHFRNKFSILERNKRINKIYDQILARI